MACPPTQNEPKRPAPSLPRAAVALAWASCVVAAALVASGLARGEIAEPLMLGLAVVAAFLCGAKRVRLSADMTVSTGFVIVFATLIRFGPTEALLAAAASGLSLAAVNPEGRRNSLAVVLFAMGSLAVTAWVSAQVFTMAGGHSISTGALTLGLPTLAAAAAYHVVNCALVAAMGAVAGGARFRVSLAGSFRSAAIAYYAGAGWAVLIHLAWQLSGVWIVLAALPLLLSIHDALSRRASPQVTSA